VYCFNLFRLGFSIKQVTPLGFNAKKAGLMSPIISCQNEFAQASQICFDGVGFSRLSGHLMAEEYQDGGADAPGAVFATTHWSVVIAAGNRHSPEQTGALEKLCATYWYPLYVFARRRGSGPEEAKDLTQGFVSAPD
jgi:hypothetical protein